MATVYGRFNDFAAFGQDAVDTTSGGSWDWLTGLLPTVVQTTPAIISSITGHAVPTPKPPSATPTAVIKTPSQAAMGGMPSWLLPVGIGLGALVLLFAFKKRGRR